jgi:rRNA maturation protein Nop10
MAADTYDCEHCGSVVIVAHQSRHEANDCKELQRRARKREYNRERMRNVRRALPSRCGKKAKCALKECGAEFVSQGVSHRYCHPRHADMARNGDVDEAETARLVLEMAPLAREQEAVRRAAEAVPMLSPEASHRLWLRCLGVAA